MQRNGQFVFCSSCATFTYLRIYFGSVVAEHIYFRQHRQQKNHLLKELETADGDLQKTNKRLNCCPRGRNFFISTTKISNPEFMCSTNIFSFIKCSPEKQNFMSGISLRITCLPSDIQYIKLYSFKLYRRENFGNPRKFIQFLKTYISKTKLSSSVAAESNNEYINFCGLKEFLIVTQFSVTNPQ